MKGDVVPIEDLVQNKTVMNQAEFLGVTEDIDSAKERLDEVEETLNIIEEGGGVIKGSYVCGRWTQIEEDAVHFGRWTPTVLVESA